MEIAKEKLEDSREQVDQPALPSVGNYADPAAVAEAWRQEIQALTAQARAIIAENVPGYVRATVFLRIEKRRREIVKEIKRFRLALLESVSPAERAALIASGFDPKDGGRLDIPRAGKS